MSSMFKKHSAQGLITHVPTRVISELMELPPFVTNDALLKCWMYYIVKPLITHKIPLATILFLLTTHTGTRTRAGRVTFQVWKCNDIYNPFGVLWNVSNWIEVNMTIQKWDEGNPLEIWMKNEYGLRVNA